jgi:hypothetical protein
MASSAPVEISGQIVTGLAPQNVALEFRPVQPVSLRMQLQHGNFYLGGDLSFRF